MYTSLQKKTDLEVPRIDSDSDEDGIGSDAGEDSVDYTIAVETEVGLEQAIGLDSVEFDTAAEDPLDVKFMDDAEYDLEEDLIAD